MGIDKNDCFEMDVSFDQRGQAKGLSFCFKQLKRELNFYQCTKGTFIFVYFVSFGNGVSSSVC